MSLSDYDTEYRGGLYVATNHGRYALKLNRGDAVMHQSDLLHGVQVDDLERHPIYPHAKTYAFPPPSSNSLSNTQTTTAKANDGAGFFGSRIPTRASSSDTSGANPVERRTLYVHTCTSPTHPNHCHNNTYKHKTGTDGEASWIPRYTVLK